MLTTFKESSTFTPAVLTSSLLNYFCPNITHLITVNLNNNNCLLWLHQIRAFFLGQNYMRNVDGTYSCLETEPEKSAWVRAYNVHMSHISATLFESNCCKSSAEIWALIEE